MFGAFMKVSRFAHGVYPAVTFFVKGGFNGSQNSLYSVLMPTHKKRSVGIKELRAKASEIIATVQRTGQAIVITKNNQEVAQITPIPKDPYQKLIDAGLILPGPKPRPLSELKLNIPPGDASLMVRAILEEREED